MAYAKTLVEKEYTWRIAPVVGLPQHWHCSSARNAGVTPIFLSRIARLTLHYTSGDRAASITSRDDEHVTIAVAPGGSTVLRLPIFYHPYWYADVNGGSSAVLPDANGAITLSLPHEAANVQLDFIEPYYLAPPRYVALLAWLAALALTLTFAARRLVGERSLGGRRPSERCPGDCCQA